MSDNHSNRVLSLSDATYQLLLLLYPAVHRRDYGPLMARAFHDLARDAHSQAGLCGLLVLWLRTLPDVAVSAAVEHWDALAASVSPKGTGRRSFLPKPWHQVGMAVLPGLFLVGLRGGLFQALWGAGVAHTLTHLGVALLSLLLVIGGVAHGRRFPAWTFPALGTLVYALPSAAAELLTPPGRSTPAPFLNLLTAIFPFLLAAIALLFVVHGWQTLGVLRPMWRFAGCVALLLVVSEMLVALLLDRGGHPLRAVLSVGPVALWWTASLLLPVVLGLLPARRTGLVAGLVVLAGEFWLVDELFDPSYALGMWTASQLTVTFVNLLPALFFLVLAPLLMLRARSTRMRLAGLLVPAFLGLVIGEAVSGSVRPYYADIWLTRAVGVVHFLAALVLAALIYHQVSPDGEGAEPISQPVGRITVVAQRPRRFGQKHLNRLATLVAGMVFAPFYLAALASLLVRTGVGYEALPAMSIPFYVPYFLASAIFFSSAAGYLLVSALTLALALGALIWGRSGNWGRLWMVVVLLAVIAFPWLHRYRPALAAAPGYEMQVLTQPGPLEGIVRAAQITLEGRRCRYELLGWSPDDQLYYRASCDSRTHLLRYDPGQPGTTSLAAALPPNLVQARVTRGDVLEMVRAHGVWPRDAEPSVRSLALEGMGYPSPDGRWMAAVIEHLYGPQDVVVLYPMAY
jgi:hypothetical protein